MARDLTLGLIISYYHSYQGSHMLHPSRETSRWNTHPHCFLARQLTTNINIFCICWVVYLLWHGFGLDTEYVIHSNLLHQPRENAERWHLTDTCNSIRTNQLLIVVYDHCSSMRDNGGHGQPFILLLFKTSLALKANEGRWALHQVRRRPGQDQIDDASIPPWWRRGLEGGERVICKILYKMPEQ